MGRHIHAIEVFSVGLAFEACPFIRVTVRRSGWFHFMRSRVHFAVSREKDPTQLSASRAAISVSGPNGNALRLEVFLEVRDGNLSVMKDGSSQDGICIGFYDRILQVLRGARAA